MIANLFHTYFSKIADKLTASNTNNNSGSLNNNNPSNYLFQTFKHPIPNIKWNYTSTKEIAKIIKSFQSKNSHGYDRISVKILKLSIPFIISPLTYIFNRSLSSGTFPTHLKFSEIKPLFKKGDRTNISNYRPISLLTSFYKIFDKVIYSRLYHHINQNNILVNEQYGFRNSSSTEKASF
jgi:hypothetical protein